MVEEHSNIHYEVHELPHVKKQAKFGLQGKCDKCIFWQSLKDGFPSADNNVRGVRGDNIGECRYSVPMPAEAAARWPLTHDFDWCGRFHPRAGTGGLAGGMV